MVAGAATCRRRTRLFLWFFAMLAGTALLLTFAIVVRRRPGGVTGRTTVLLAVALISRRHPAAGAAAAGLDPPHVGDVRVVAVRDRRRRRGRAPRPASHRVAPGARRRHRRCARGDVHLHGPVHVPLLRAAHPRAVSARCRAPCPVDRDGRTFYFGNAQAAIALQQAVDDLEAVARPGERLFVGPLDLRRTWYSDLVAYWMFPSSTRRRTTWRWIPGWPTPTIPAWPTTWRRADWVLLTGFWAGWYEPEHLDRVRLRRPEPGGPTTSSARWARTRTASSCSSTAARP